MPYELSCLRIECDIGLETIQLNQIAGTKLLLNKKEKNEN